jgi:hypothetical protein
MSIITRPHHSAVSQSNVNKASEELEVERHGGRNKDACGKAAPRSGGSGSGRNANPCKSGGSGSGRGYSNHNTFDKCATTIHCNVAVPTTVEIQGGTHFRCAPPAQAAWAHPAINVSTAGCNETIRPVYDFAPVDHCIQLPDVALNGGSCVTVAPIVRVGGERIVVQGGSAIDQRCAPTFQRAECVTEQFACDTGFKGVKGVAMAPAMAPAPVSSLSSSLGQGPVKAPVRGAPVQGAESGELPPQEARPASKPASERSPMALGSVLKK